MKQCPQCKQIYSDLTLNFCLSDGTPLIFSSGPPERETVVIVSPLPSKNPQVVQHGISPIFAYLAIGLLALIAGGGIVAWMKSGSDGLSGLKDRNSTNRLGETDDRPNDTAVRYTNKNTGRNTSENSLPVAAQPPRLDTSNSESEVNELLHTWVETITNKDLDGHMIHYADRPTTYYTKRGVNRSYVRSIYKTYYDTYSVLEMRLSNIRTEVNSTTGEVVSTFDKTFNFTRENGLFEGAVESELRWAKINGIWKITSERDLREYRTNKK